MTYVFKNLIPILPPLERKMVKLKTGLSYSLLGGLLITF